MVSTGVPISSVLNVSVDHSLLPLDSSTCRNSILSMCHELTWLLL
ncbi:hypothetical protein E2C01_058231 [Portunus trituberculatus]|uniref:Uncharacterized protein n=1 Tax=Portunus trituberculatus TaxID=210409 RepID=A0A5B7GVV4_PORTR|nr:hypothetical protein [Portunus trituberculatus]